MNLMESMEISERNHGCSATLENANGNRNGALLLQAIEQFRRRWLRLKRWMILSCQKRKALPMESTVRQRYLVLSVSEAQVTVLRNNEVIVAPTPTQHPILCGNLNIPIIRAFPDLHPTRDHFHPVDHLTNDLSQALSSQRRKRHQPLCSQALGDIAPKIDYRRPPLKAVLHCRRICGSLALESVRPHRPLSKWDRRSCVTRVAGLLLRGRAPTGNMIK